jgi:hypothetical protein
MISESASGRLLILRATSNFEIDWLYSGSFIKIKEWCASSCFLNNFQKDESKNWHNGHICATVPEIAFLVVYRPRSFFSTQLLRVFCYRISYFFFARVVIFQIVQFLLSIPAFIQFTPSLIISSIKYYGLQPLLLTAATVNRSNGPMNQQLFPSLS